MKTVLFNNWKLTSPHSIPLNNLNHCTQRQYLSGMTAESLPEVTLHPHISVHVYRFPFPRFPSVHVAYPYGNPAVNFMKHEESLRAEKNLHQRHKASSVSVLRSPLDDAKSKYISSNQTARYEGNRGDLPTFCVWMFKFKQYQSVYLDWNRMVKRIVQNAASAWVSGCASKPEKWYLYEQYIEEWGHQGTSDSSCMRSFLLIWLIDVVFDSIVYVSFTVHNPKEKKGF